MTKIMKMLGLRIKVDQGGWGTILADKDRIQLEQPQKTATKIIFIDSHLESYEERLSHLNMTTAN